MRGTETLPTFPVYPRRYSPAEADDSRAVAFTYDGIDGNDQFRGLLRLGEPGTVQYHDLDLALAGPDAVEHWQVRHVVLHAGTAAVTSTLDVLVCADTREHALALTQQDGGDVVRLDLARVAPRAVSLLPAGDTGLHVLNGAVLHSMRVAAALVDDPLQHAAVLPAGLAHQIAAASGLVIAGISDQDLQPGQFRLPGRIHGPTFVCSLADLDVALALVGISAPDADVADFADAMRLHASLDGLVAA